MWGNHCSSQWEPALWSHQPARAPETCYDKTTKSPHAYRTLPRGHRNLGDLKKQSRHHGLDTVCYHQLSLGVVLSKKYGNAAWPLRDDGVFRRELRGSESRPGISRACCCRSARHLPRSLTCPRHDLLFLPCSEAAQSPHWMWLPDFEFLSLQNWKLE